MPSGQRPATTKTEFARYLNENEEAVPSLKALLFDWRKTPHRLNTFGIWLRINHEPRFRHAFESWWLRHPELFGTVGGELAGSAKP